MAKRNHFLVLALGIFGVHPLLLLGDDEPIILTILYLYPYLIYIYINTYMITTCETFVHLLVQVFIFTLSVLFVGRVVILSVSPFLGKTMYVNIRHVFNLGGAFKYFSISPLLGEMIHFD